MLDQGYAIKVSQTWRDLYTNGQILKMQGGVAVEMQGRLGRRAERWQEICGAYDVRVMAFDIGEACERQDQKRGASLA